MTTPFGACSGRVTTDGRTAAAIGLASGRRTEANAAFALAVAGEPDAAEAALAELLRRYPQDKALERSWTPAIRGASALARGDARAAMAATVGPGDRAVPWARYVRARADLELGRPSEAAAEFRALLAAKSALFANSAFFGAAAAYPAARVGAARALVRAGRAQAAGEEYEAFLALWSRADPDVPLLLEARREHAALVRAAEKPARSR